jgi:hypothetical protein
VSKISRLVLLVLLFWGLTALAAWSLLSPQTLVGGKMPPPTLAEDAWRLGRPELSRALAALERVPLWGANRDGSPLAPEKPAAQSAESEFVAWRFGAAVTRPGERYALILREGKSAPLAVKEGETLPSGGILLRVEAKTVVYIDPENGVRAENLVF